MGMRVLACKLHPERKKDEGFCLPNTGDPEGLLPDKWFGLGNIGEMLSLTDILVICLPLTPETRGVIGQSELAKLPRNAYLINVGRGEVVAEEALLDVLRKRRIAGAALDVFPEEPLPAGSPLVEATQHDCPAPHRLVHSGAGALGRRSPDREFDQRSFPGAVVKPD